MEPLNLSRVAFGCSDLAALEQGIAARAERGEVFFTTRNRPRRAAELTGGYLYFIIRHTLVARLPLLDLAEAPDGRTDIVCRAALEPVAPTPRRAHQGWRYLEARDAPAPLAAGDDVAALPPHLARELAALALI